MSKPEGDYVALSISYGDMLLIPFEYAAVLPKLRYAETSWSSNTKQIVLKDRETNFTIIPAEQVLAAAATQKLLGE